MKRTRETYAEGGYQDGVPNAPGVPSHVPAQNLAVWEEVDDGLLDPTLVGGSDDGYRVWLDENAVEARLWVSRPGADHQDKCVTFFAPTVDPTILTVVMEDAIREARAKCPALVPVKRDDVKARLAALTQTEKDALRNSVVKRASLT